MTYLRTALLAIALAVFPVAAAVEVLAAEDSQAHSAESGTVPHDEDGGDHGDHAEELPPILSFDPGSAIANVAIFLGVFAVLAKFVWPVILDGLKAREEKIAGDLQSAQDANVAAAAKLSEYEKKVADVAAEAQTVLADARKDAQANATKIIEEAKADAQRQAERALADIETAKKVALSEIAGQTSSLAMGVAKQVVGRELKADDHADLIRKALDEVPSNN